MTTNKFKNIYPFFPIIGPFLVAMEPSGTIPILNNKFAFWISIAIQGMSASLIYHFVK